MTVVSNAGDREVFRCEVAVYGADSRNLLLRKVYGQDSQYRLLFETVLIPLHNVKSVEESRW